MISPGIAFYEQLQLRYYMYLKADKAFYNRYINNTKIMHCSISIF